MKLRKWKALLRKDLKLSFTNKSFMLLLLFPIGFAYLYSYLIPMADGTAGQYMTLVMVTNMAFMMLGSSSMGISIAEEKEKKTLRSLMLSNVKAYEFLICKMLIMTVLFTLSLALSFYIIKIPTDYFVKYLLMSFLTSLSLLFISAGVGLIAKNQQDVTILGTPVMLVGAIPLFSLMMNNNLVTRISYILPTGPITFIMTHRMGLHLNYSSLVGLLSMLAWIILAIIGFSVLYQRHRLDN